jgi:hypothetical protein
MGEDESIEVEGVVIETLAERGIQSRIEEWPQVIGCIAGGNETKFYQDFARGCGNHSVISRRFEPGKDRVFNINY